MSLSAFQAAGTEFTSAQRRQILSHGPWPPPMMQDQSNPASGNASAIGLGRRLFFDARLSPSGKVSCSSCHRPERAWTDGRPRGIGLEPGQRNTPALYDLAGLPRYGWSGSGDSLWAQSIRPLLDPAEMGSSAAHVQTFLAAQSDLAESYLRAFGHAPDAIEARVALTNAAKALAAYQETIVSARSSFDDFRDAVASQDVQAQSHYPAAARRGLMLFIGKGGCTGCHAGPRFSDASLHDIGTSLAGRAGAAPHPIRVPGLRNVAETGPYLHDGRAVSLGRAIRAHRAVSAKLRDHEVGDLERFLATLSEKPR